MKDVFALQDKITLETLKAVDVKLSRGDVSRVHARGTDNLEASAGVLKPNEARAFEDLPPVTGGDVTYMQSQMVPTGTLPAATVARSDELSINVTTNMAADSLKVESITPPEVRVEAPQVNVAPPPPAEVIVHNDMTPIAEALRELHLGKPTRRFVRRDERGRIVEIVDYPEGEQEMVS